MQYPFSLIIPAITSLAIQIVLWSGYFFYIPWLTRLALFWGGLAGAGAAAAFLFFYRVLASLGQRAWNLWFLSCGFLQIASLGASLWIAWTSLNPS